MPYIGHGVTNAGTFYILDDLTMSSSTTYTMQVGGVDVTPKADNLLITLDGVVQHTPDAYTVSGSTITFDSAPGSGVDFYGIIMGQSATIGQGSIGADELKVTGDGSSGQVLASDGDGTFTWTTDTENYLPLAGGTMTGNIAHASDFTLDVGGDITLDADGGDIIFKDGGTAIGKIYADGDAGAILHLDSDSGTSGISQIRSDTDRASDGGHMFRLQAYNQGTEAAAMWILRGSTDAKADIVFNTSNAERLRIDEDGKVGIGTATPDEMLHLKSSTSAKPVLKIENTNDDATAPTLEFCKNPATDDTDNDVVGQIDFIRQNDEGNERTWGQIRTYNTDAGAEYGQVRIGAKKGAGSPTDILYIGGTSGGNVGIGTDSPQRVLDVKGTSDQPVDGIFRVLGTSEYAIEMGVHDASPWGTWIQSGYYVNGAGTFTSAGHLNLNPSGGRVGIGTDSPGDDGLSIAYPGSAPQLQLKMASSGHVHISNNTSNKDMNFATAGTGDMYFAPGGTNHVAFLDSGYVGIGTLSPNTVLHVKGTAAIGATIENDSDDAGLKLDGKDTALYFTNYGSDKWKIYSTNDADKTLFIRNLTHGSTAMRISNSSTNPFTFEAEQISIDSAGNAYCIIDSGSTSYASWAVNRMGGANKWYIGMEGGNTEYRIYDVSDGSVATHMAAGGSSWTANSDERMKKDITSMENRLDDLLKIKVRRFKWKHSDKEDFGFVAQELVTCAPDAVEVGSDEVYSKEEAEGSATITEGALKNPYGVSREQLIPMMVKSIQELSAKVTALENA